MRSNNKILYYSAGMVGLVLVMGCVCYGLFGQMRDLLGEQFQRSELAQQDSDIAVQAREIHLSLYKALSWSSSGYEAKKVEELLRSQAPAISRLEESLRHLQQTLGTNNPAKADKVKAALTSLGGYRKWAL